MEMPRQRCVHGRIFKLPCFDGGSFSGKCCCYLFCGDRREAFAEGGELAKHAEIFHTEDLLFLKCWGTQVQK